MTAPETPNVPSAAPARTRGWVKVLLAASLALNLLIIGLAAGAFMRGGGPSSRMDRSLGLGPVAEAMQREDWKALRPKFIERHPELRAGAEALRGEFEALVLVLRAEPFDPAALDAGLAAIAARNSERLSSSQLLIGDYLKAMDPAARRAFAERLEAALERGAKANGMRKGKEGAKPGD